MLLWSYGHSHSCGTTIIFWSPFVKSPGCSHHDYHRKDTPQRFHKKSRRRWWEIKAYCKTPLGEDFLLKGSKKITRIHGIGIFSYMNGSFLWFSCKVNFYARSSPGSVMYIRGIGSSTKRAVTKSQVCIPNWCRNICVCTWLERCIVTQ